MRTITTNKGRNTATGRERPLVRKRSNDLSDPKVLEEIRREAALLKEHPEEAAINDWLDAMLDTSDWPPYEWPAGEDGEPDKSPPRS